jgi:gentisate 1,2-dioxygenase
MKAGFIRRTFRNSKRVSKEKQYNQLFNKMNRLKESFMEMERKRHMKTSPIGNYTWNWGAESVTELVNIKANDRKRKQKE